MADDYTSLGLGELTSLVTDIQIKQWGTELWLHCVYDPLGERVPYALIFQDCRQLQWEIHDAAASSDLEADLIGMALGQNNYRQVAIIHTDIFELSLLYGTVSLRKAGNMAAEINLTEKVMAAL